MSRLTPNGFKASSRARPTSGHSAPATNWDKRLSEARAKREQILSAQAAGPRPAAERSTAAPVVKAPPRPARARRDHPVLWGLPLSRPMVLKAGVIFAAAAGFGFGIVLAVGLVVGPQDETLIAGTFSESTSAVPDASIASALSDAELGGAATVLNDAAARAGDAPAPVILDRIQPALEAPAQEAAVMILPEIAPVLPVSVERDVLEPLPTLAPPPTATAPVQDDAGAVEDPPALQFFMHAPDGIPDGDLQVYVAQIEATGIQVAEIGRESFRVSSTHLRYYSPETATIARTVAAEIGVDARDFSQNVLNPGRIEIWVAGRPRGQAADGADIPEAGAGSATR